MGVERYKSNLDDDEKLLIGVVRAAELIKRAQSAVFRRYGLSFPQYNTLRVLAGSKDGRNNISSVGKIMLVAGANMTGVAKRLEKAGFIRRCKDSGDDRVTMLQISPAGKKILGEIEADRARSLARIMTGISSLEKKKLLSLVKQLLNNGNGTP